MGQSDRQITFEAEVTKRFGILPNFFRSAEAAPEFIQQLWSFAKAGYLYNPVGFLLGNGRPAGEANAPAHSITDVIQLLKRPTPWQRDMSSIYLRLGELAQPLADWPDPGPIWKICSSPAPRRSSLNRLAASLRVSRF